MSPTNLYRLWLTAIVVVISLCGAAEAQTLITLQFEPQVMVPSETTTVRLEALVSGVTRVTFESLLPPGGQVDMKDDGTGGDRIAGDSIFTITLNVAPILQALRSDDVYRPLLGYMRPYFDTTLGGTYNILGEVSDPQIPQLPVVQDAVDVQHTDYVVNILMPQAFPSAGTPSTIPSQSVVTNRFYQLFADTFDVINVVYVPRFFQNLFHYAARNAVQGIGLSTFNNGGVYGSASRLKGISVFPAPTSFDGAATGLQHEFGHQWINFLPAPQVSGGRPHWPFSTMASGIMGFSIPPTGQGGGFACLIVPDVGGGIRLNPNPNQAVFNDFDLYLMGLMPPEQVSDQIVLGVQDSTQVFSQCNGSLFSGVFSTLPLSDITSNGSIGPRVPAATTAQKDYRMATIVVTRDSLLSSAAMSYYSFFARRMEAESRIPIHQGLVKATGNPFAISARGLGTMSARLAAPPAPNTTSAIAVSPASGSGAAQTFTFTFYDPQGWQDLDVVNILINSSLDGGNACYLAYSRPLGVLYLVNDAGNGLLPGLLLNGTGSMGNNQCTVSGAGSWVLGTDNTLRVVLNISFGASFTGNKVIYLSARDGSLNNSGWQAMGSWLRTGGASTSPSAGGVTPGRGTGLNQALTFSFSDAQGWLDLNVVNVLIQDFLNGNQACYLAYSRPLNTLYLVNDAGTQLLPGLTLNGSGSVSNSQCMVTGAGSSASGTGNILTLTVNLSFFGGFGGNRVIYLAARDTGDVNNSGWQAMGTWNVR